jgi:hypothetical protein
MITILKRTGISHAVDGGRSRERRQHSQLMLAAVVSAAVHDFQHPQVNNNFLINYADERSVQFNDQAVSENHSIYAGLKLLGDPQFDFTGKWVEKEKRAFRKAIVNTVLGTDMTIHFEILTLFETKIGKDPRLANLGSREKFVAMDDEQKLLTLRVILKVADLGHVASPYEQHMIWANNLSEEFFLQGDREKAAGDPVSFLMDRSKPGASAPRNQVGFIRAIALPLFKALANVFPEVSALVNEATSNLHRHERDAKLLRNSGNSLLVMSDV